MASYSMCIAGRGAAYLSYSISALPYLIGPRFDYRGWAPWGGLLAKHQYNFTVQRGTYSVKLLQYNSNLVKICPTKFPDDYNILN